MTYTYRRAVRTNASLIIGLIGPSGSGKTYSAMELATGIMAGMGRVSDPFAVLDTENGRALHYADDYLFDHCPLEPPFRPSNYADAIWDAYEAGFPVIVVDSGSHAHEGEGGIVEWQQEELKRLAGDDYKKREACSQLAWVKPKLDHKRLVRKLLRVDAHVIICLRAEEKTKMIKNDKGKMAPTSIGFQPICEKKLPYELIVSLMLDSDIDRSGYWKPIKLQSQHRSMFPAGQQISRKSGELIAQWARGGTDDPLLAALSMIRDMTPDQTDTVAGRLKAMGLKGDGLKQARDAFKARRKEMG